MLHTKRFAPFHTLYKLLSLHTVSKLWPNDSCHFWFYKSMEDPCICLVEVILRILTPPLQASRVQYDTLSWFSEAAVLSRPHDHMRSPLSVQSAVLLSYGVQQVNIKSISNWGWAKCIAKSRSICSHLLISQECGIPLCTPAALCDPPSACISCLNCDKVIKFLPPFLHEKYFFDWGSKLRSRLPSEQKHQRCYAF